MKKIKHETVTQIFEVVEVVLLSWVGFILLKIMFDLPGQNDIEEVIIDTGVIKGDSEPIIVHSKNKTKQEKTSAA